MERSLLHRIRWGNVALAAAAVATAGAVLLQPDVPDVPAGTSDVAVAAPEVAAAPTPTRPIAPPLARPLSDHRPQRPRPTPAGMTRARVARPRPASTRSARPVLARSRHAEAVEFGFER